MEIVKASPELAPPLTRESLYNPSFSDILFPQLTEEQQSTIVTQMQKAYARREVLAIYFNTTFCPASEIVEATTEIKVSDNPLPLLVSHIALFLDNLPPSERGWSELSRWNLLRVAAAIDFNTLLEQRGIHDEDPQVCALQKLIEKIRAMKLPPIV